MVSLTEIKVTLDLMGLGLGRGASSVSPLSTCYRQELNEIHT